MNWYMVLLAPSEIANGERDKLIRWFTQIYEANGAPQGCTLFEMRVESQIWQGFFSSSDETAFSDLEKEFGHCLPDGNPYRDRDKLFYLAGDREVSQAFASL